MDFTIAPRWSLQPVPLRSSEVPMASILSAPAAPQPLWFTDNLAEVHLGGDQTGDAWSLVEISGRRGDMPPLHVHRKEDEAFYVLEGELKVWVGDTEVVVPAGRAAFAP